MNANSVRAMILSGKGLRFLNPFASDFRLSERVL
jgi:hypothetical protein